MIPIKSHIKALQDFEKNFKELSDKIEAKRKEVPKGEFNEELYQLLESYIKALKAWEELDNVIELKIDLAIN